MTNLAVEELTIPQGTFSLARPSAGRSPLRAWDAADEYLLRHLHEVGVSSESTVLVVNDGFGALGTGLAQLSPMSMGDSVVAERMLEHNLVSNGIDPAAVTFVPSLAGLPERIDVAVIKIPKTLALLEHQLNRIRPLLHAESIVVGAGMTRHVHNSTIGLFEQIIGTATTSLAVKKARLIHAVVEERDLTPNPWPAVLDFGGHAITSHAGVFSSGRIDQGTRLLAGAISSEPNADAVIDLGCGSGVLGLAYALENPDAGLHFIDVSYLAIASAQATWQQAFGDDRSATFEVSDRLNSMTEVDLILNNPPFHEQHVRGDDIAWQMFGDGQRALRKGGVLLVVGNRHLGYHAKLKRRFGNCETVRNDDKFVVLRSQR